jgi:hypothetical protein
VRASLLRRAARRGLLTPALPFFHLCSDDRAAPSTATQSSEPIDTVSPVLPAESFPRPPAFALSLTLQAPPATAPSYPVSTEAAHPVSASAAPSLSAVSSDAGAVVGASSSAGCLHDSSVPALPLASGSAASKGLLVPVDPSAPLRDQDVEIASADLPSTGDGGAPGSNPSRDAQSASSPSVPQPTPSTGCALYCDCAHSDTDE